MATDKTRDQKMSKDLRDDLPQTPHFKDDETEAQKDEMICLRFLSCLVAKLVLMFKFLNFCKTSIAPSYPYVVLNLSLSGLPTLLPQNTTPGAPLASDGMEGRASIH